VQVLVSASSRGSFLDQILGIVESHILPDRLEVTARTAGGVWAVADPPDEACDDRGKHEGPRSQKHDTGTTAGVAGEFIGK
jgi:hypothetical protein